MQTLTQSAALEETREGNYIHNFRELFGADKNIDDTIIAKQKEIFGFSLFLLHSKNIFEALRIGFLNSRELIESRKNILSIPHTYIFGGMALGFILQAVGATFLFLPIFFGIVFLSTIPIFRAIRDKMILYKDSRIFFNIDTKGAQTIQNEFLNLKPFDPKKQIWRTKGGQEMNGTNFSMKIFLYLFSQPFIFGHLQFIAGFSFHDLLIFDIALFLILFGIFEKGIFLTLTIYYSIYFYLFDKFPFFFSREDQERDFYMDLYESGNQLLTSLDALEKDITDAKSGIIQPSLGKNLSQAIHEIEELYTLIDEHAQLLEGKEKFQQFLIGMLNEILTVYGYIFDFLSERILSIESGININELDEIQQNQLLQIVKPILENKKSQLQKMKEMILSKRIG